MKQKRSEKIGKDNNLWKIIDRFGHEKVENCFKRSIGFVSSDKSADKEGDRLPINKQSKKGLKNQKEWYE